MLFVVLAVLAVIFLFIVLGFAKDGVRVTWKVRPRQILCLLGAIIVLGL